MNLKLSDTKIIGFLVIALIAQILFLLWHMNIIGTGSTSDKKSSGKIAGHIESIENQLKRRPLDSLIWENSKNEEKIYYFDSVLTLSESTAKIILDNGTQIQLSENTLVTIEPPDPLNPDEIRIQFNKGNLKARNPYSPTEISDGNLKISLEADSDIEIAKNSKNEYEVLLNSGSARLFQGNQELKFGKNELVSIKEQNIERFQISQNLKWKTTSPTRVYSHNENILVHLEWEGQPDRILIFSKNYLKKEIEIDSNQNKVDLYLPPGDYRAVLNSKKQQSSRLQLELWKAPLIQLVQPLPRNRSGFGKIEFIWTPSNRVHSFELEIKTENQSKSSPSIFNKFTEEFSQDKDIQWGVWGVDQKGFKIPPLYYYPLFIRENPFAPPKLNKPRLLEKKKKDFRSSWIQWLIPEAFAQDKIRQTLFSWQAIEGAEIYVVEISDQADFRNPIVKVQVEKPEYLWSQIDDSKKYLWRVAAGDKSGRMGIFSEPIEVIWELPAELTVKEPSNKHLKIKKKSLPAKPTVVKKTVAMPEPSTPKKVSPETGPKPETPDKRFHSFGLYYQAGYGHKNFSENGSTKANLNGLTPLAFSLRLDLYWSAETVFSSLIKYMTNEYEPNPKSQFPFQSNLKIQQISFLGQWQPLKSGWGLGLLISSLPSIERVRFEEVKAITKINYGVTLSYKFRKDWMTLINTLGPATDGKLWGAFIQERALFPVFFEGFQVGAEIQYYYLSMGSQADKNGDFSIIVGYEF